MFNGIKSPVKGFGVYITIDDLTSKKEVASNKPKVIKSYSKLDKDMQQQIKLIYADGFADNLIHFFDKNGVKITVLPFETEDKYYTN